MGKLFSKMSEAAPILTTETLPAYIIKNKDSLSDVLPKDIQESDLKVSAIMGGNVNYAFCVSLGDAAGKIFVKQAPEFVAIFGPDGFPLTSERMQKEMDIYEKWGEILGNKKYLPEIYMFDRKNMVVVMEFFDGFHLLDDVMVKEGIVHPDIAKGLGEFMGKTHAATHSSVVSEDQQEVYTKEFENRPMRDIQLEFVFTKCYKEATDEQRAGLIVDEEFMKEVNDLKSAYNGTGLASEKSCGHVLSHGDLHPGSVMVDSKKGIPKVIDPEFCVYGPPGLDVGSLLSGFVLAAVHHAHNNDPKVNAKEAVESIRNGAAAVWSSYKEAIMKDTGISSDVVDKIGAETVGFTVSEVCRTALGFAGGRLWLQFEDEETKKAAIKTAMGIVQNCMVGRHTGGIDLLLQELDTIAK